MLIVASAIWKPRIAKAWGYHKRLLSNESKNPA
jgi:hypothetical protein